MDDDQKAVIGIKEPEKHVSIKIGVDTKHKKVSTSIAESKKSETMTLDYPDTSIKVRASAGLDKETTRTDIKGVSTEMADAISEYNNTLRSLMNKGNKKWRDWANESYKEIKEGQQSKSEESEK